MCHSFKPGLFNLTLLIPVWEWGLALTEACVFVDTSMLQVTALVGLFPVYTYVNDYVDQHPHQCEWDWVMDPEPSGELDWSEFTDVSNTIMSSIIYVKSV